MTELKFQRVCVIGLGYIGLPTASLLASKGFDVVGVDVNETVVKRVNAGEVHIREPELDVLVSSAIRSGRLRAQTEPAPADVFILAVPTPCGDGHKPDLTYVEQASRAVAQFLSPGNLIILESTSPVGTSERIAAWLSEERPDLAIAGRGTASGMEGSVDVFIAHCPERVLPGHTIRELVENDRIVGGIDLASTELATSFYKQFVSGKILATSSRVAELAKLTENTFRDVNIALANELSIICDDLDVDVYELIELANHHPRVNILQPGPGVGGHCIAVDPWFIVDSAPKLARLIRVARETNDSKPAYVIEKVRASASGLKDPVIACLGLAYKPDIDDLRESPAVRITHELASAGLGRILAVEPNIQDLPPKLAEAGVELTNLEEALERADIVVALVGHMEFRQVSKSKLGQKALVDTIGLWRA